LSGPRARGWRVLVDRGGTFTDVVAVDPDGRLHVRKVLARDAPGEDAITHAVRSVVGDGAIASLRAGTTLATNALLERRTERVALAVTRGFADVLLIGSQERPELFALAIEKPAPITECVVEIDERVLADGSVRRAPDEARVREQLRAAAATGCRALAVALVHAARFPEHERLVGAWAREAGFEHVVLSHEVAPEPGHLARTETTVVDAALTPILLRATSELRERLGHPAELRLLTSAGGLVRAEELRGRDAVLSGPAGGAVALAHVAREAGLDAALGFDMGGTSTDVSRWSLRDGVARTRERRIAGVRIRGSMVDVVTVAAGGGSVLARAGNRFTVGPGSAGAVPGPACYGLGGPATITDANLVLGRLRADLFPRCFGRSGREALDVEAARSALAPLADSARLSIEDAAAGFLRIANERMAHAIREVSVARGHDPREHVLVPFGGAGAQHACALADLLGMTRIVLHPLAGVLSALGAGLARATRLARESVLAPLDDATLARLAPLARALEARLEAALQAEGDVGAVTSGWRLEMRHAGVEGTIDLPWTGREDAASLRLAFDARHLDELGFERPEQPVEIASLSVEASATLEPIRLPEVGAAREPLREAPLHLRADLRAGHVVLGPALIAEEIGTIVLDEGWSAVMLPSGSLLASRNPVAPAKQAAITPDAVRIAIYANRFMAIAEQMGEALRRTSLSVNIKERLDYSCALFSREGSLVANAPHVPVHLGAMGETVRALLHARGAAGMREGIVLASNDPYHGGSHLPDITVVSPVHDARGELAFFVANRGHHADVGGVVPGSMPPFSGDIAEEGVLIHDLAIVEEGRFREQVVTALLGAGPHPVRGIPERVADLRAQAAANALGARLLAELCAREGTEVVARAMRDVLDDAAAATREALRALPQGAHRFEDRLDDGAALVVTVSIDGDRARFDFAGTSPQLPGNLNAPRAITTACVLYVLRCLVRRDVPLNAGCLEPVEIVVPAGSFLDPHPPAAVAGGNVETSMRIADVLLGALGAQAASQGTMNNVTFGDASFGYYETIAGGAGAGPTFDGADAVHSHLTNTRITDVEVLEARHPVILRELSIRRGSGGRGRHHGGDGIVRAIELRAPLQVAVLSERRTVAPFGLQGGEPGARGRNRLVRADGSVEDLGGKARCDARPGDVLIIETPGGGGFGAE
jgi:5-oxoprolinase (ATP-hydrolysing)